MTKILDGCERVPPKCCSTRRAVDNGQTCLLLIYLCWHVFPQSQTCLVLWRSSIGIVFLNMPNNASLVVVKRWQMLCGNSEGKSCNSGSHYFLFDLDLEHHSLFLLSNPPLS